MNTINSHIASNTKGNTIVLDCNLAEMQRLYEFIEINCQPYGLGKGFCLDLQLALEEAIVNVMSYAFPSGADGHTIELRVECLPDAIRFDVIDDGIPFNPTAQEKINTDASFDERDVGGLGIHLFTQIMNRIEYQRTCDGKNILTLYKTIH